MMSIRHITIDYINTRYSCNSCLSPPPPPPIIHLLSMKPKMNFRSFVSAVRALVVLSWAVNII